MVCVYIHIHLKSQTPPLCVSGKRVDVIPITLIVKEQECSNYNLISMCFSGLLDLFMGLFRRRMQIQGVSNWLNGASVNGRHCPLSLSFSWSCCCHLKPSLGLSSQHHLELHAVSPLQHTDCICLLICADVFKCLENVLSPTSAHQFWLVTVILGECVL